MPGWARAMQSEQAKRHHRQVALHALQQGDRGGASATPDIKERND
jgi:type IV secretion system protein TrbL